MGGTGGTGGTGAEIAGGGGGVPGSLGGASLGERDSPLVRPMAEPSAIVLARIVSRT